ncbi:selenium metabolism-associated LysR family transcriptional regulator [Clostridium sediminicola]|uniref:selenium metabolism-associated LysR family transcriptional regulator n=1 Tax=Clostridium sediminicola TaxID=3114879 RepID=UPI0031F1D746
MDFKQLITFIEIVNLKSFSKASKKMFLTQPTVTNHIQRLEEELGIVLFDRNGREITLTDAGFIFFNYAQEMVNLKDTAIHHLNSYKSKIEGTIEINSSSIPAQYILPYFVKDFNSHYPGVSFRIKQTDSKKVHNLLKEGFINFGIIGARYNYENIEYTKLIEDRLVLALPPSFKDIFSPYDTIDLQKLSTLPLILREEGSGSRYLIEKNLKEIGFAAKKLNIISEVSSNEAIKKMIKLNIGSSFISELAIKEEIETGSIIPVEVSDLVLERNFYFICHKKRFLSPLNNTFKDFVLNNINKKIC